jgi:methionyl-tRNA formyltransferase
LTEQDTKGELRSAPKIHKETCQIDWNKSSVEVFNFVRGLNPYPSAWAVINEKKYKIHKVSVDDSDQATNLISGQFEIVDKKIIHIKTVDGFVILDELQPEGKKRMNAEAFLRGNTL